MFDRVLYTCVNNPIYLVDLLINPLVPDVH